jgi:hypothetical protein
MRQLNALQNVADAAGHGLQAVRSNGRTRLHVSYTDRHARHNLMSKLVPQPQLLVAPGMPVILNWLPINSMV